MKKASAVADPSEGQPQAALAHLLAASGQQLADAISNVSI